jgi:hypothetical protein
VAVGAEGPRERGRQWIDRAVVEDGNLITSRGPDDLDAFCEAILARLPLRDRKGAPKRSVTTAAPREIPDPRPPVEEPPRPRPVVRRTSPIRIPSRSASRRRRRARVIRPGRAADRRSAEPATAGTCGSGRGWRARARCASGGRWAEEALATPGARQHVRDLEELARLEPGGAPERPHRRRHAAGDRRHGGSAPVPALARAAAPPRARRGDDRRGALRIARVTCRTAASAREIYSDWSRPRSN